MRKSYLKSLIVATAALVGFGANAHWANAAYSINIQQSGGNVTATGSGSINTIGLTNDATAGSATVVRAYEAEVVLGPSGGGNFSLFGGISGPTSFGSGGPIPVSSSTGSASNFFYLKGDSDVIGVPVDYVSNAALPLQTDTWTSATFTSLGLTPGTYNYTWGAGPNADSLTVQIGSSAVPEPTSLSLLGIGALGLLRRRSRRVVGI